MRGFRCQVQFNYGYHLWEPADIYYWRQEPEDYDAYDFGEDDEEEDEEC